MKFLCDNCKAKYQIGDEKIAGKMVRMKCRRCGHLIQVSASVTESSVAQAPPVEGAPPQGGVETWRPELEDVEERLSITPMPASVRASEISPGPQQWPTRSPVGGLGLMSPSSPSSPRPGGLPSPGALRPGGASSLSGAAPRSPAASRPGAAATSPDAPGAPRPPATSKSTLGEPRPGPAVGSRSPAQPGPIGRPGATLGAAARAPVPATLGAAARAPVPSGATGAAAPAAEAPATVAGVAGAFKRSVADRAATTPAAPRSAPLNEDWYVGVGGVPLGPVRLAVIREKALGGAVDGDSLVWREGYDEWQPLKNFPELLEIVTEAQAARQAGPARRTSSSFASPTAASSPALGFPARSVTPTPTPAPARAPSAPLPAPASATRFPAAPPAPLRIVASPAPLAPPPVIAPLAPPPDVAAPPAVAPLAAASSLAAPAAPLAPPSPATTPLAAPPATALSAVLPPPAAPSSVLSPQSPASRAAPAWAAAPAPALAASAAPLEVLSDPFAIKPPGPVAPAPVHDTVAAPVVPHAPAPRAVELAPLIATPASLVEPVSPRRRAGMSPLAYAFIAMAAAFGGVSAFVLLSPRPVASPPSATQPQAGTTQVQAPVGPAEGLPPPPPDPAEPVPTQGAAPPDVAVQPRPGGFVAPRPPEKPAASGAPIDTSGFNSGGVAGPSPAGPSGAGPNNALGQLSPAEISGVVESNRPGVRRRCWQPALEARAANAPSTARVSASVVIGASGSVQSVSAGGSERDYPGLSSCIAARIKTWKFSPSSGSTPVNIPFVFAAQ